MVMHVVMWKIVDGKDGKSKNELLDTAIEKIDSMKSKVPSLRKIKAGKQCFVDSTAWDLLLYSEFDNYQGLQDYIAHPYHIEVANFIGSIRTERAVVDYELP